MTHDQEEALSLSDRVAIMKEGKLVQIGAPREIYKHPQTVFASDFVGGTNLLSGTVIGQRGGDAWEVQVGGVVLVAGQNSADAGDSVFLSVRPEEIRLVEDHQPMEGFNVLEVAVGEVVFLGNLSRVRVDSALDTPLWIEFASSAFAADFEEGQSATILWPACATRVLVEEEPE